MGWNSPETGCCWFWNFGSRLLNVLLLNSQSSKSFKTTNIAVVESCQAFFAFEILSVLTQERNKIFLTKVAVSGVT